MYTTSVFSYIPRQIVVVLSGTSPRKYVPQYAKPLTLHKGVDNQLQFQFLNQDQKPVNITGLEITCRILNYQGNAILLQKALTLQLAATGIAALQLNTADIEGIDAQKCYYTLEIPSGSFNYPVFVDSNAGGRGDLNIVNSILPSFVPSQSVYIPTGQLFPNNNTNANANSNAQTYFTSVISTDDNPILTLQAEYTGYYGNVQIQGSSIIDGDWYNIGNTYVYTNLTSTEGYTVNGFHPYIQVQFVSNIGDVTNILTR